MFLNIFECYNEYTENEEKGKVILWKIHIEKTKKLIGEKYGIVEAYI